MFDPHAFSPEEKPAQTECFDPRAFIPAGKLSQTECLTLFSPLGKPAQSECLALLHLGQWGNRPRLNDLIHMQTRMERM